MSTDNEYLKYGAWIAAAVVLALVLYQLYTCQQSQIQSQNEKFNLQDALDAAEEGARTLIKTVVP